MSKRIVWTPADIRNPAMRAQAESQLAAFQLRVAKKYFGEGVVMKKAGIESVDPMKTLARIGRVDPMKTLARIGRDLDRDWEPLKDAPTPRRISCAVRRNMNKAESRFAAELDIAGIPYLYECIKLRLGEKCFYTPDFCLPQGFSSMGKKTFPPTMVEIKALWTNGRVGWREDARVKFKAAAERYPFFRWAASWINADGEREYEWIK